MEEYSEYPVRLAKGTCGPITAVCDGEKATCYECGSLVYARKEHKRRRNGIDHMVRSHFFHKKGGALCTGESIEHLAAKDALIHNDFTFYMLCGGCGDRIHVYIEGRRELETVWNGFRLDVGVFQDTTVVGAIEVLHTHAMENAKMEAMTSNGLAWCEVYSKDVLSGEKNIPCVRCAVPYCDSCKQNMDNDAEKHCRQGFESLRLAALKQWREAAFRRVIDAKFDALEVPISKTDREWLYRGNLECPPDFDLDTLIAITGVTPDPKYIKEVEVGWEKMIECLKKTRASQPVLAQQILNQKVIYALEGCETSIIDTATELVYDQAENVLDFGKYNGTTIDQVFNKDPGYVKWLAMWSGFRDGRFPEQKLNEYSGKYKDAAREKLKGVCLMCFDQTGHDWKHWCRECYRDAET